MKEPALTFKKKKRINLILSRSKKDGQYWLTLQSANGNKIMHTEQYKSKRSMIKIVKLICNMVNDNYHVEIKDLTNAGTQKAKGH